jgi:polyhydroxyalkanoate synthesis regulator phasin
LEEFRIMHNVLRKMAVLSVAAGGLLVSACASVDDVKHAQATADQALSTAQQAQQTATAAQQAAQAAQQSADSAHSDINALTQRVNTLENRHKGERG